MVRYDGLSKAEVLCALYNRAKCLGLGVLHYENREMTIEEAEKILKVTTSFDYLKGRVMKVDLLGDESFEERFYDRDNGEGSAQSAVDDFKIEKINPHNV